MNNIINELKKIKNISSLIINNANNNKKKYLKYNKKKIEKFNKNIENKFNKKFKYEKNDINFFLEQTIKKNKHKEKEIIKKLNRYYKLNCNKIINKIYYKIINNINNDK